MQKNLVITPHALLCAAMLLLAPAAPAADFAWSGFGTIGYAQSDQPYNYERFINRSGTFERDTVFGAQMDARFSAEWNATVQAKLASAIDHDSSWKPVISWAFLSYRPTNDLLLRAGKLRMPFYLNAENMDVGATYAAARLPNELYSVSPTMDFSGASFVQSWTLGESELDLDGYWGQADMPWRHYSSEQGKPTWSSLKNTAKGLVLTLRQAENVYRAGLHNARIEYSNGHTFPVALVSNPAPVPGMTGSYYAPSGFTDEITTPTFNLAADVALGNGYRAMGEYVRRTVDGMDSGPDTESSYLSLLKEAGRWTPYLTYAQIKSRNLSVYQAVNGASVQGGPPGVAASINAAQREAAAAMNMYDQHSWAIGSAYAVDRKSRIKAEWKVVHAGAVSGFVDVPAGDESGKQRINVFSLSYNFMF